MSTDVQIILAIALAGVVGGIINAFLSDNGFAFPHQETTAAGTYWRPGYLGNVLVGTAAALISWGLYGPYATYVLLPAGSSPVKLQLSLTNLVGALLVGVAGSRWLSSQVDKNLLSAAVTVAAATPADPAKAVAVSAATTPSQKLQLAKGAFGLPALPDQPN